VSDDVQTWQDVKLSNTLTDDQRKCLTMMLEEYSFVLSSEPGRIDIIKHVVVTTDEIHVRLKL
jgi:hypothetical protein